MMTESKLLEDYKGFVVFERRLSGKTLEVYYREASRFLSWMDAEGRVVLSSSVSDIEEYLSYRQREGDLEPGTESRILSSLRSFFLFLTSRSLVDKNPAKLVEKPKDTQHLPRVLSEEEVDLLLSAFPKDDILSERDYTLFELIYSSGMRISEAVALDVSSCHRGEKQIQVRGKRGKERLVFIGDVASEALESYLTRVRPKLQKDPKEEALFLNRRGGRLTRQAAHKRFHETAGALGMDATIHTLRHSFATHMLEHGADVRSVQEMLGHSDVRTTQLYTHLDTASILAFFDKYSPLS